MSFQMLCWYLVWERAENWRPGVWLTNSFKDRGRVNLELGVGDGAGGGGYGNWRAEGISWGSRTDTRLDCTQALALANWQSVKSLITKINHEGLSKGNHSSLENPHAHPLITSLLPACSKHVDFLWRPLVLPPVGIISGLSSLLRNSKLIHTSCRHRVNSQWSLLSKPTATFNPYYRHTICFLIQQTPFEFVTCLLLVISYVDNWQSAVRERWCHF